MWCRNSSLKLRLINSHKGFVVHCTNCGTRRTATRWDSKKASGLLASSMVAWSRNNGRTFPLLGFSSMLLVMDTSIWAARSVSLGLTKVITQRAITRWTASYGTFTLSYLPGRLWEPAAMCLPGGKDQWSMVWQPAPCLVVMLLRRSGRYYSAQALPQKVLTTLVRTLAMNPASFVTQDNLVTRLQHMFTGWSVDTSGTTSVTRPQKNFCVLKEVGESMIFRRTPPFSPSAETWQELLLAPRELVLIKSSPKRFRKMIHMHTRD